jgi:hypothetical protein
MKDNDTYTLSSMYGDIVGEPEYQRLDESTGDTDLLTEQLMETLGQQLAVRVIRLIRAHSKCTHKSCMQQLEKDAEKLLHAIEATVQDNPMVMRTLAQHRDTSSLATINILYKILTEM